MNKEEFLKEIMELPKIETNNSISAMNVINVDDLMSAVDRFNKVPDYNDLLKENKQLKDNWNKLKEYIRKNIIYDDVGMKILDPSSLEDYIQELEQGSDK